MKKILLGLSVFLITLVSAQNYPDYYPNDGYGNSNNYGDYDDEYYFPDDYYYEYPSDYYSNDLYRNYYSDYRQSINDVNWNRFFAMQRLSPWQMQQIIMLNNSYSSYSSWNSSYRYNPDRWYYDRFYALQRILGPSVFVVFQNNYYNGYSPVIYYQNYNRRHYARNVYVVPRYRNVNVNVYRVNKVQYQQSNPRNNIGFQQVPRSGQTGNFNNTRDNGFRNDNVTSGNGNRNNSMRTENTNTRSNSTRTEESSTRDNNFRRDSQPGANSLRTEQAATRNNNFRGNVQSPSGSTRTRNDASNQRNSQRSAEPARRVESNSGSRNDSNSKSRTPVSSSRNSGQRLTSR